VENNSLPPNRYSPGSRANPIPWSKSGEGWFAKGYIVAFFKKTGTRNSEAIHRLLPLSEIFPNHIISSNDIYNRFNKGTAPKYEKEHPDKHRWGSRYYREAEKLAIKGFPLTIEDVRKIVTECDLKVQLE